jgi:nucleotide-binding universal stress UspA family protein
MKTILVPLDGSALAERVLPYVRGLAPLLGAKVCLLQSLSDADHDTLLIEGLLGAYGFVEAPEALRERKQRVWETMREHAEGYLATQALELREAGLDVETEVNVGPPAKIIIEVAQERHATLIAMATHGYGGVKRWTLGGVTDQVVHMATTPVLVVHGAASAPQTDPTFERILVPLDGSAFAHQALPLARELAANANAELVLLEAIAPSIETQIGARPFGRPIPRYSEVLEMLRRQATQDLGALANQLRACGLHASTVVKNGPAAEVIVDEAAQGQIDLIVMATHGYSGMKRWALGSVAHKVLHGVTTPILLVRTQAIESQLGTSIGTATPLEYPQSIEDEVGVGDITIHEAE